MVVSAIIGSASTASIASGNSSTDRYYSIGDRVKKDGSVILTFTNSSTAPGTLLSITNLKLTFTQSTAFQEGTYSVNRDVANTVLKMLNAKNVQTVVLPEAELEVSLSSNSVKEGANVTVKATTNENVDYLTVNGQKVTEYKQNKKTGMRTWTLRVKAEEAGDMEIVVTAFDAEGRELESAAETVQVTAKKSGSANKVIGQLLDQLFG